METIRTSFRYTEEDLADFLRGSRFPRGSRVLGVMGLIVTLFLFGGAVYAMSDGRFLGGIAILLYALPFLLYALRSFGKIAPRKVEVPPEGADERRVEISEQALNFDSGTRRASMAWAQMRSFFESDALFLLYQHDNFVRIIPK